MADKCIGKLYLDIGQVKKDIEDVNKFLSQIGANINLEDKLSKKIGAALKNLVDEAKKAGAETQKAIKDAVSIDTKGGLESTMQKVTSTVNTYSREVDKAGQATSKLVSSVQTGFDAAGNKIKEFADSSGAITKRTEEIKNSVEEQIDAMWRLHDAEEKAYEKQGEAAVKAGLQREQAAQRATEAEAARSAKEVATMEADLAKRTAAEDAALEKQISADAAAQEKLRQQSIETEFAREEARKREAAIEEDLIHKEVAAMEESLAQEAAAEEAALNKQVQAYEEAEEKKRQASIKAEFEREEARQRATEEELDLINKEVAAMEEAIQKQQEAAQKQFETDQIEKAKQAYFELTDAIKNYNAAKKDNDTEGMATAQARIDAAMQEVASIQQIVDKSMEEGNAKQQVLNYIQQCVTAEHQHVVETKNVTSQTSELESQVKGLVTRYLSLMAVIRTVSNLMKNMVEYVSEYSDKMNEIQMITMKTDAEVAQLSDTYRSLAKDMNVSTLDMADAAIYFTRQGLGAADIEKRLKNVTMYAKAANVEFKDASEIITAVVNSMNLMDEQAEDGRDAAQRVADVFLEIGDHAATSGQEIGEAMQKAAASAGAFGVSMEWLAAYIATVSETTRQEARTIGTAFNTIIARLHQIKSTGYNQEDETKINDIAKALSKIDVALMDQDGNWRDMEVILEEVAGEWDKLDGKTKSYIATTMAGVKQQNVFLALMNDMSKGIDGGSRAFELHERAMDSDGVAAQKYGVYLDSVTAAQERLTIAQENFYSLLNDSVVKGWYDALAGVVDFFTEATDKMNGFNIIVPVVVGGVWLLVTAFGKLAAAATAAGGAMAFISSHPVIMAIAAITAGILALSAAASQLEDESANMKKTFQEASSVLSDSQSRITTYVSEQERLKDMISDVGTEVPMTSEKLNEYNELLDQLKSISPEAAKAVDDLRQGFGNQAEAVRTLSEEIDNAIKKEQQFGAMTLINKYSNWTGTADTNNPGFIARMGNWDQQYTSDKNSFAQGLQYYYNNDLAVLRKNNIYQEGSGTNFFTKDVIDEIDRLISQYTVSGKEADWGYIGDVVWSKFVGNGKPGDISDALMEYVNEAVDDVMTTLGATLNETDRGLLRQKLLDAIMGEDGKLDASDYQEMGDRISKFISGMWQNGFDFVSLNPAETINYIGENYLGEYFSLLFGDQLEELKNDPEFANIAKDISDAVSELVSMGFSNIEIANVLESLDLSNWGNAVSAMREKIFAEIKQKAGTDDLGMYNVIDMLTGEEAYDPGMWDSLDTATLKLVNDLMDAGVEFANIQMIMDQSTSVTEFAQKIRELSTEMDVGTEEAFSFSDSIKNIQNSVKDIQAIDNAIEDVQKNGKDFNMSDMFALAQTHQELMTVIDDEDALLESLIRLKDEATSNQRGLIKTMLLGSTDVMSGSSYAASGYDTLKEYRDSLTDPKAIEEFDAEIEQLVNEWQRLNEIIKKSSGETTEAEKSFSAAVKEVETLDTVISKLENEQKVDFSDIIDLSTAHPEIIAVSGDMGVLLETLKNLRNEAKETVRLKIQSDIMNSKEWMANSEFASTGYETIGAYRASLNPAAGEDLAKVDQAIKESTDNIVGLSEAMGNLEESNTAAAKSFDETIDEIEDINTALDKLEAGKKMDFSDLIDLSTAHPEILGAINDIETLKEVLASIRAEDTAAVLDEIYSKILGDDIKNSPFKDMASDTIKTLNDYKNTLEEGSPEFEAVSAYLEQCAMNLFAASDYLNQLDPETIKRWQDMFFSGGNVDLNNRKTIDARKLTEAGWEGAGEGIATLFSSTYSAGGEGADIHWNQNVVFDITPITADGKVLTPTELEDYMNELFAKSTNMDELLANDAADKGLLIKIRTLLDNESFESAMESESKQMELLHLMQEAIYGVNEAEQTWLQTQAQQAQNDAEADWAESNGYLQQITGLQQALEEGGAEAALATFNGYLEQNQDLAEGLADKYPAIVQRLADVESAQDSYNKAVAQFGENSEEAKAEMSKLQKATKGLGGELNNAQKYLNTKYFKNTANAIKDLSEGTITAAEAYDTFADECDNVTKAQEDVNDATQKFAKGSNVVADDVSDLANLLGKTTDQILSDWPAALDEFYTMISAGGELESVFNALNEAAFIKITGTSECDFSAIQNALLSTQNLAEDTINMLIATGQWQLETLSLPQEGYVFDPLNGTWTRSTITAQQTVLKPTGSNPFSSGSSSGSSGSSSSSSGGGGGGGGSSSSSSGSTEVEKMLDLMSQVQDIQENQKSYYQAQRDYYSQTGLLQGVIAYAEKEKEVLEDQNATLQDNIENIEEYMRAKQEELNALSTSDESYEEVADDLDQLQDAHADYTQQIIENKTAIEELNEAIDDTNDAIRQMEIDLRDLIYGAIEDREEKRAKMLESEIEMENIIIDLLKKRYEIERDDILNATNDRIDALQKERDLLDEQLAQRKAQAEAEDKVTKLKELEVKYQRIIADPTRAKEAKQIQSEIEELRKDMAWDLAEEEVKAQQDSIDQQITSLEDYVEYVENYYNDLFEHPQKLIDEMRTIITGTQEEILEWLKENDEEYKNSTENTQLSMVEGWTQTYNDMKGILTLYWDEVEEIIAQGDDYIINFLKENSADYAAAGKLQAEAYVDEWMEQLENLKKAYQEVSTVVAASYEAIEESTYSGSSGSGGGSSSSSSSSSVLGNISTGASILSGLKSGLSAVASKSTSKASSASSKWTAMKYASGGEASSTGLAWLDGSLQEPERVLSPYQTKLFNSMVEALQNIDRISVPGMSNLGNIQSTGSNPISVGDIIVNVDNLDTDDDYEELAQKVSEVLMDRIGKTSVIGGLRIRSV